MLPTDKLHSWGMCCEMYWREADDIALEDKYIHSPNIMQISCPVEKCDFTFSEIKKAERHVAKHRHAFRDSLTKEDVIYDGLPCRLRFNMKLNFCFSNLAIILKTYWFYKLVMFKMLYVISPFFFLYFETYLSSEEVYVFKDSKVPWPINQ